jgi:nucleoside-diphosphate-sugar epimerase
MRVLVIGCGYTGKPLAEDLAAAGHEVFGASRGAVEFAAPVTPVLCDITQRKDVANLPARVDWVINTVSSSKGGLDEYRDVYVKGSEHLLAHIDFQKFVFTSSTSVYGQNDGSVVTEDSAAEPQSPTSSVLREAENLLLGSGKPVVILRPAGIYGPDRGALFMQYLRADACMRGDGSRFLNMVHRDDLIGAIRAALERGRAGEVYNVVDDEPVPEAVFFDWLEEQLRRGFRPPCVPESAVAGRKRGVTNKKVSNRKLKEIGYTFKYPTFREGYAAEIARMRAAGMLRGPTGA